MKNDTHFGTVTSFEDVATHTVMLFYGTCQEAWSITISECKDGVYIYIAQPSNDRKSCTFQRKMSLLIVTFSSCN